MMERDCLPSYWDLPCLEAHSLFYTQEPQRNEELSAGYFMSVIAACLLAVVPVGHLTYPGRRAVLEVGNRFRYFFLALFGRWNKDVVAAYDIFGQVERMAVDSMVLDSQDRNRVNIRYSQVIDATIAPRAILLQLFPWLTIWSVFSVATSRCAMWVRKDSDLLGKSPDKESLEGKTKEMREATPKPHASEEEQQQHEEKAKDFINEDKAAKVFPWLISFNDAFERAQREDNGLWKKRMWITYISALRIVVLYSRAIQYTVSSYMTFVSVWVLFHPANKAVLASIVIVLLPLAIAQGLGLVLVIGKALNVKDLQDVGRPGETDKMVIKHKDEGKSKEQVKEILVAKFKEKKRKLCSITAAEDKDAYDFSGCVEGEAEADKQDDGKSRFLSAAFPIYHHHHHEDQRQSDSRLEHNDVEMTTTHRHKARLSVAEAILPARISIIPRDSIGPEMAPSRLSYDGVVDPHRSSILALSNHHHVLQAHGHLTPRHQQHSSPDPNPGSGSGSGSGRQGQEQHIRIHLGQSTDCATSPLAALRLASRPAAPQGSPLQSFSRLPSGSADPAQAAVTVRVVHRAPVPVSRASSREDDAGASPPVHRLKFSGTKDEPHGRTHG
jgi:hypothetical protein